MSDNIETAVTKAIDHANLKGNTVEREAVANIMNEVYSDLQRQSQLYYGKNEVPASYMKVAANEAEDALKKYGISGIEFYDSGKDGKPDGVVGKEDTITVYTERWGPDPRSTFKIGERQQVSQPKPDTGTFHPADGKHILWKAQQENEVGIERGADKIVRDMKR